jgi:hypothetical protein
METLQENAPANRKAFSSKIRIKTECDAGISSIENQAIQTRTTSSKNLIVHRRSERVWTKDGWIDPLESKRILPFARMAAEAYNFYPRPRIQGFVPAEKKDIPEYLHTYFVESAKSRTGRCIFRKTLEDTNSGMKARVYKHLEKKQIVIAFAGTEIKVADPSRWKRVLKNVFTNLTHAAGLNEDLYDQADRWVMELVHKYGKKNVIACGTSLGGTLSKYTGLMNEIKAYSFNPPGILGEQLRKIHEKYALTPTHTESTKKLNEIANSIGMTTVYVQGEWLCSYHPGEWFGKEYTVPFHDQSWLGYYRKNHHGTDAIIRSLETTANA